MSSTLQQLPTVLVVGALVAIFLSLRRHTPTPRLRMWLIGWGVILLQLILALVPVGPGTLDRIGSAIQLSALAIAGMAFLLSMTTLVNSVVMRSRVLALMSIPLAVYSSLLAWQSDNHAVYIVLIAWCCFGGAAWFFAWYRKLNGYVAFHGTFLSIVGVISIIQVSNDDFMGSFFTMLMGMYGMSALLFVRRSLRLSPGVILTSGGFLAWALVWALASFANVLVAAVGSTNLIWDVPKFFVGFGMIVTLLEDQYFSARAAGRRERMLNVQMARFADFTSKLLGGVQVRPLCGEIARVINEVANFRRVAICLLGEDNRLFLAGWAGLPEDVRKKLEDQAPNLSSADIAELCINGRRIAADSYIYSRDIAEHIGSVISTRHYRPNPNWHDGDELVIPLRTGQGNIVGCISLDDPKSVLRVTPEEISKIEMLANDLGVAIEKNSLQQKVMLHEKLASVGQLVSGVAHELNNPLTAVMGYAELMADADADQRFQREISIIRREAQRMKTIIDNLLRFSRQSRTETRAVHLESALQEAISLRHYDIARSGVQLEQRIQPHLPHVACDEAQFKTVIVHLLNNALDALRDAPEKTLSIEAQRAQNRVTIRLTDSGPGFNDLDRIFDPFFTTKGVGRGTGLGLSICYGIVKQHGGEISAQNVEPRGARITIELLVATEAKAATASN